MSGASTPPKTLLIVNPTSCHGEGAMLATRAQVLLQESLGGDLTVIETLRSGHAERIAEYSDGRFGLVIVLGGDGVVHEAVNGIMRLSPEERPVLAILPAGSGNDYAFSLGMSPLLDEAVRQVLTSPRRPVDLGVCNGRYFVETLSFGLDAGIALDTVERRMITGRSGPALYAQSGLNQLLHHFDFHRMRAWFDGVGRDELIVLCAVQMGPTYGAGFRICPDARFDDGLLDVCVAHAPVGRLKAGLVFLRAKSGGHLRYREIELQRVRTARLVFDAPLPVQIDGERMEALSFDIGVEPGALRVVAPDGAAFIQGAGQRVQEER